MTTVFADTYDSLALLDAGDEDHAAKCMAEPIRYETPGPPERRPFWPRGLNPIDFAIMFGGLMTFMLLED